MSVNPDHDDGDDRDYDPDLDHANDNGVPGETPEGRAIVPKPAGGALMSLTELQAVFNRVNTAPVTGRSGLPLLLFKREGDGTYSYGRKRIIPEAGSHWAANIFTFQFGYVYFDAANKPTEVMVSVSQPKPDLTTLPNAGFRWQEQWSVNLKCLDGADAGTEVNFKMATVGGVKAIAGTLDLVRDRLNGGRHGGDLAPIVLLEKGSYPHPQFGRVWEPILTLTGWMSPYGPAPTPQVPPPQPTPPQTPTPQAPTAEQPRRRRVA
jgi:hypothetical protein